MNLYLLHVYHETTKLRKYCSVILSHLLLKNKYHLELLEYLFLRHSIALERAVKTISSLTSNISHIEDNAVSNVEQSKNIANYSLSY